jgi:two-component system phosphate regulon sensor histidine kinase PhoR
MPNPLRRTSFTTRLLVLAALVLLALVAIDYGALLRLPGRIARDSVEIALRENVQALNSTFRDDRSALTESIRPLVDQRAFRLAVVHKDREAIKEILSSDERLPSELKFQFVPSNVTTASGFGPVTILVPISSGDNTYSMVFYEPVNNDLLNRAAGLAGGEVAFAIELDDRYVARGSKFPASIHADELDTSPDPNVAELSDIKVDGDNLHVFSRVLSSDRTYQLHALSTKKLEEDALSDTRSDVRTAIAGMTAATIVAFLLLALFTSRSVRGVSSRVRTLADGDYGSRLPVRGNDSFADLSGSVNRLSVQLQDQLGQLEDTAGAFRRTLETLEEGICVWTEDGEVAYWNRGAEQLTGLARERADRSAPIIAFLHAERAPGSRRVTLPVRRTGSGLVAELVVTAMPDGGVVQTFRDTSMVDMLQQTQRNFMATAAHELRTPITTILGFADTLSNPQLQLTEPQRAEFIQIIGEQSRQLQEIADAFFTNHQLANERVEVSILPTTLDGVVRDAIERVERSFPERATDIAAITFEIPESTAVLADRRALVGVVSVLVENAIKYGGAPIVIAAERKGGTIALLVRDEGPGIDAYHQGHVFDPFYRIDVDMRSGIGGAGLGLFTARKLVEAMHGVIRVRSAPGAGATFVVELPAAPVERGSGEDEDTEGRSLRLVG